MIDSEEMDKNLPLLTILVGIQGSGKSTWAGNQDDFDGLLLSSDALRSEYPNWGNDEIFKEIYSNVIQQSDMRNIAPDMTIYQFLDKLDEEKEMNYIIEVPIPKILINDTKVNSKIEKGGI